MKGRDEYCGTCRYHRYDKDSQDYICTCPESEYIADWTAYTDWCEEYEAAAYAEPREK